MSSTDLFKPIDFYFHRKLTQPRIFLYVSICTRQRWCYECTVMYILMARDIGSWYFKSSISCNNISILRCINYNNISTPQYINCNVAYHSISLKYIIINRPHNLNTLSFRLVDYGHIWVSLKQPCLTFGLGFLKFDIM